MKLLTSMRYWLCMTLYLCVTLGCSTLKCDHCAIEQLPVDNFPPLFTYSQYTNQAPGWRYIYLEGDGRPWKRGYIQSSNPTSRQKLTLKLMMATPQDSVYLERPCYGFAPVPPAPCEPYWWTSARYNQQVAEALNNALDQIQQQHGHKPLVLIGHSGGGTLAMLIAQKRNDIAGIVTLAGNIDPDAWTEYHNFLPLEESSNPSRQLPLPSTVFRWHYAGESDRNIPPALIKQALSNDPLAELNLIDSDHNCCWLKHWPQITERLRTLEQQSAAAQQSIIPQLTQ